MAEKKNPKTSLLCILSVSDIKYGIAPQKEFVIESLFVVTTFSHLFFFFCNICYQLYSIFI